MDHHLVKVGAFLATIFLLYNLVRNIKLHRSRAALKQATGAQSAIPYPQWERIVGWDAFRDSLKAFREHRMLVRLEDRFKETGTTTFSIVVLGRKTIMTLEPQNLKVIQALDHKKWGLGQRRVTAFKPLLGNGEFFTFFLDDYCCIAFGESSDVAVLSGNRLGSLHRSVVSLYQFSSHAFKRTIDV